MCHVLKGPECLLASDFVNKVVTNWRNGEGVPLSWEREVQVTWGPWYILVHGTWEYLILRPLPFWNLGWCFSVPLFTPALSHLWRVPHSQIWTSCSTQEAASSKRYSLSSVAPQAGVSRGPGLHCSSCCSLARRWQHFTSGQRSLGYSGGIHLAKYFGIFLAKSTVWLKKKKKSRS